MTTNQTATGGEQTKRLDRTGTSFWGGAEDVLQELRELSRRLDALERRPAGEGKGPSPAAVTETEEEIVRVIAKHWYDVETDAELVRYDHKMPMLVETARAVLSLISHRSAPNPLADLDPEKEAREISEIVKSETYLEHGFYLHDHTVERITRVLTARFRELKEGRP